jgi:hypothetical protein
MEKVTKEFRELIGKKRGRLSAKEKDDLAALLSEKGIHAPSPTRPMKAAKQMSIDEKQEFMQRYMDRVKLDHKQMLTERMLDKMVAVKKEGLSDTMIKYAMEHYDSDKRVEKQSETDDDEEDESDSDSDSSSDDSATDEGNNKPADAHATGQVNKQSAPALIHGKHGGPDAKKQQGGPDAKKQQGAPDAKKQQGAPDAKKQQGAPDAKKHGGNTPQKAINADGTPKKV